MNQRRIFFSSNRRRSNFIPQKALLQKEIERFPFVRLVGATKNETDRRRGPSFGIRATFSSTWRMFRPFVLNNLVSCRKREKRLSKNEQRRTPRQHQRANTSRAHNPPPFTANSEKLVTILNLIIHRKPQRLK